MVLEYKCTFNFRNAINFACSFLTLLESKDNFHLIFAKLIKLSFTSDFSPKMTSIYRLKEILLEIGFIIEEILI